MDINFCGPRFMWKNGKVQERLDWALSNFNWFSHFFEAYCEHLNWFKSNHRPIIVRMGCNTTQDRSLKRFRFLAAWATKESFSELIKDSWRSKEDWPIAISHLKDRIIEWNNTIFGNINLRKRSLTRRLQGIDRANPEGTNVFLNQLQETLWKEYERTLLHEEILWCQRARSTWLQFGNRNTRFFHASSVVRKKRNKILSLIDDNGNRVTNSMELKRMATNFFKNLYYVEGHVDANSFPI